MAELERDYCTYISTVYRDRVTEHSHGRLPTDLWSCQRCGVVVTDTKAHYNERHAKVPTDGSVQEEVNIIIHDEAKIEHFLDFAKKSIRAYLTIADDPEMPEPAKDEDVPGVWFVYGLDTNAYPIGVHANEIDARREAASYNYVCFWPFGKHWGEFPS